RPVRCARSHARARGPARARLCPRRRASLRHQPLPPPAGARARHGPHQGLTTMTKTHEVLIVGGGTAGLSVAARLRNAGVADVAIIEPSDKHYYQPLWTLVGAGIFDKQVTERDEADYIPAGATWIRDKVASFDPDNNAVTLASGQTVGYQWLIVAAGIQLDWDAIEGLREAVGHDGVVSN